MVDDGIRSGLPKMQSMTRRWFLSLLPAPLAARFFPETLKKGDRITIVARYIVNEPPPFVPLAMHRDAFTMIWPPLKMDPPLTRVQLDGVIYPVECRDTPSGPQWFVKGQA